MSKIIIEAEAKSEISRENILKFLYFFQKRRKMYGSNPENYDIVTSFLKGYMYCCYLHG